MMKSTNRRWITVAMLALVICSLFSVFAFADGGSDGPAMYATFWALVPPIIAIGLALITKEVYSSLFIGIVAGALLVSNGSPVGALNAIISDGFLATLADDWDVGILLFLVMLGMMWRGQQGRRMAAGGGPRIHTRKGRFSLHLRLGASFLSTTILTV